MPSTRTALEHAARAPRDRPHPLLDRRRKQAGERATVPHRLRARPDRGRAQRQPRQRARAARRAGPQRLDLPDRQRHRSHPPSLRAFEGRLGRRGARRVDRAGSRRLLARAPDEEPLDCRPRSERVPSARARPARRCLDRLLGDLRARSDRRHLRTRRRARRELLVISDGGVRSIKPFPPQPLSHCVFEHVYFARPDSYVFGRSVNEVRTDLGRILAREAPVAADVVVPIPDSGVCAAIGYAEEAGLPMKMGLIRNHYVGRTFIQPQQSIRHFSVSVKLNPVRSILEGRRVDPARRFDRARHDEPQDRQDGEGGRARARCTCASAVRRRCPRASTASTRRAASELIAATHTIEEIRKYVEADSLAYLSLDGLRQAVGTPAGFVLHVVLHRRLSGRRSRATSRHTCSSRSRTSTDDSHAPTRRLRPSRVAVASTGLARSPQPPASQAKPPVKPPVAPPVAAPKAAAPEAQGPVTAEQLRTAIDNLGIDRLCRALSGRAHRATRRAGDGGSGAARRRSRHHADQYVRFRALVLLSGFNDPRTRDVMVAAIADKNDRLRTVAYAYFEHNPDKTVVAAAARGAEQRGIGVRPAGADARAGRLRRRSQGSPDDGRSSSCRARPSSAASSSRRSAITAPPMRSSRCIDVAKVDGPLQDDAALALGKIGDKTVAAGARRIAAHGAARIAAGHCRRDLPAWRQLRLASAVHRRLAALLDRQHRIPGAGAFGPHPRLACSPSPAAKTRRRS